MFKKLLHCFVVSELGVCIPLPTAKRLAVALSVLLTVINLLG